MALMTNDTASPCKKQQIKLTVTVLGLLISRRLQVRRSTVLCLHCARSFAVVYDLLLSVQCNTLHGTEYKISCGVSLCLCVLVSVCARTGFEGLISRKRLKRDGYNGTPIGNGIRRIEWRRNPDIFGCQYLEDR